MSTLNIEELGSVCSINNSFKIISTTAHWIFLGLGPVGSQAFFQDSEQGSTSALTELEKGKKKIIYGFNIN